ncbi:hypothetical protein [uncultured Roseobacter sp.]|uniref:hypothetical protein n=1 Tax=uncultured Roseobacter sp. TaxID=114847 RepID=UPI0026252C34|nr:hypothetical protein [uncultured Roseobacter sp.]
MVAYNFDVSMARPIIFGERVSCLKPKREKPHVQIGQLIHAFCGNVPPDFNHSPDCHRLMTVPCLSSVPMTVDAQGAVVDGQRKVNPEWYKVFAEAEGFGSFAELQVHYDKVHGFPYEGQYIRWNPSQAEFRAAWPLIPRKYYKVAEAGEE